MRNKSLSILLFVPILLSCGSTRNTVKIFLTSSKEVDVNQIKKDFSSFEVEASYASTDSYYYSFLYKSCREKNYQIYVLRDEEYLPSHIQDIYRPFDEDIQQELKEECEYYLIDDVAYGIKLNGFAFCINEYLSFEEDHDYYLSITDTSNNVIEFLKAIL